MNKVQPTAQQRAALQGIIAGKSKLQAMQDAGYARNTALNAKHNLTETTGFKTLIAGMDAYAKAKYNLGASEKATRVIVDALEAKRIVGNASDFIEVDDPKTQMEAADRILELTGNKGDNFSEELTMTWKKK